MANFKLWAPYLQTFILREHAIDVCAAMTSDDNPPPPPGKHISLCLLPLEHANLAAGRELMNGRRPAAEAMLLFFLQSMKCGSVDSLFRLSHCSEAALYCKCFCLPIEYFFIRPVLMDPTSFKDSTNI